MAEYCGGNWRYPLAWTSRYLVGFGLSLKQSGFALPVRVVSNTGIESLMDEGLDMFRSVLDANGLLAVLDVEYFNLDGLSDLYHFPEEQLRRMEPLYKSLQNLYHHYGIRALKNVTASGFHFIGFLPHGTTAWDCLSKPLYLPPSLRAKYDLVVPNDIKRLEPVPADTGYAYERLGRILTYLCHQAVRRVTEHTPLPLTISDVAPGEPNHPRDGISLDLTQYADPVYMRPIRMPFTPHQKHLVHVHTVDSNIANTVKPPIVIPRQEQDLAAVCAISTDMNLAAEYAAETCTSIPHSSKGWIKLFERYQTSILAGFHQTLDRDMEQLELDRELAKPLPAADRLPPCLRGALLNPNPWLLAPTNLMAFCFHLRETGYAPAEIAVAIADIYDTDCDWPINWAKYDPWSKALFWVRSYCGLLEDGLMAATSFSCERHQNRGFCPQPGCGWSIGKPSIQVRNKKL